MKMCIVSSSAYFIYALIVKNNNLLNVRVVLRALCARHCAPFTSQFHYLPAPVESLLYCLSVFVLNDLTAVHVYVVNSKLNTVHCSIY